MSQSAHAAALSSPAAPEAETDPGRLTWTPLGGNNLGQGAIGGNAHVYSYLPGADAAAAGQAARVMVDAGVLYGNRDWNGLDGAVPDPSRHLRRKDGAAPEAPVDAILLTHGHNDHIGAIGHYVRQGFDIPPVYGTPVTLALLKRDLAQAHIAHEDWPQLHPFMPGDRFKIGGIEVEAIPMSHSIPQSVGFALTAPAGRIVHTGDYKADPSVAMGPPTGFQRMQALGAEGVDALVTDMTKANTPGLTREDGAVRQTLGQLVDDHPQGRIVVAAYGGYVELMASVAQIAAETGRTLITAGPSVDDHLMALEEAGIDLKASTRAHTGADLKILQGGTSAANAVPPERSILLVTGVQAEPGDPLVQAAEGRSPWLHLGAGDVVVMTSGPLPGREDAARTLMQQLADQGVAFITNKQAPVSTSGHGYQEDQLRLIRAVDATMVIPTHTLETIAPAMQERLGQEGRPSLLVGNGTEVRIGGPQGATVVGRQPEQWLGFTRGSDDSFTYHPMMTGNPHGRPTAAHKIEVPAGPDLGAAEHAPRRRAAPGH